MLVHLPQSVVCKEVNCHNNKPLSLNIIYCTSHDFNYKRGMHFKHANCATFSISKKIENKCMMLRTSNSDPWAKYLVERGKRNSHYENRSLQQCSLVGTSIKNTSDVS